MRILPVFAAASFMLMFASTSHAMSGNELLELCVSSKTADETFCIGYIGGMREGVWVGVAGTLSAQGKRFDSAGQMEDAISEMTRYCLAPRSTTQQHVDTVIRFLQDNPDKRNQSARKLIVSALRQAYPCG